MSQTLHLQLRIWRQDGPNDPGRFLNVDAHDIPVDASFLEMLDMRLTRLCLLTTAVKVFVAPAG